MAPQIQIDPALIERFGRTMRENFSSGSVPFRKAYLQALINVIEVDDNRVHIKGSKGRAGEGRHRKPAHSVRVFADEY